MPAKKIIQFPENKCRKCRAPLVEGAVFCHLCGVHQDAQRKVRTRPNGSGSAYKRGQTWTARVVIGWHTVDSKSRPKWRTKGGFRTKREALEYCALLKNQPDEVTSLPLSHYWELYRDGKLQKLSASTQQAYQIAYDKIPDLHSTPMHLLSIKAMQDALNQAAPSFDTAKDLRSMLSNCFQLAMYDGAVHTNRAQALDLPEQNYRKGVPFTRQEISALWKRYNEGDTFTGFILLMIYTGMMPVELRRLTAANIDWQQKIIIGVGAKTRQRRTKPIVLADAVIPVLADLVDKVTDDKVMPLSEGAFYRAFYGALKAAGCRDTLTPYSCRHSTATALELDAGASPTVIAEVLRQKTITMQQQYIHPETQAALDAVNKLPV